MQADQIEIAPPVRNKKWMSRRRGACDMCKSKKVRCDGETPCRYCSLHHLECDYQLLKKQRTPPKPSIASTIDQISIEPSHTEKKNDSGVTTLISLPNNGRILPESTATHIGVSDCDSENAGNGLQQMMLATNDGRIMPVIFDRFVQDDCSATAMEWIGNGNLPTPYSVDMSNMNGVDSFPWSPLKDAYSETDFAIPFHLQHTTDTSASLPSTSHSELSLPRSPVGPMRDRSGGKLWDEVGSEFTTGNLPGGYAVRHSLANTIADDVGSQDHNPGIDFSLTAIFSPHSQRIGNLSWPQQDEVDQIFSRLSHAHSQMSLGLGNEQYPCTYARWYWSDTALMEKCKSACFEEPLGISTFLTRSQFDQYVQQARDSTCAEGLAVRPLIDSVMAFGFQVLATSSRPSADSDVCRSVISRSRLALSSRDAVQRWPENLLKMQTILAMMTISEQIDPKIYSELLSCAVLCARTRRFMNSDSACMTVTKEKEHLARRCLWYLYSIEVVHSIRNGMPPILARDWTDHASPEVGKDTYWLLNQCQYGDALSSAIDTLYSQKALRQPVEEREQNLTQAYKALESWRTGLPTHLQNIHRPEIGYVTLDDSKMRHLTLTMVHKYHEAIFIIFFPWTRSQSEGLISDHYRKKSMELCVKSAQAVLAIAARNSGLDILDGKLVELIAVSICVTFLDVVSGGCKKSLPHLSMCCGILGSLSLNNESLLTDALELTRLAQKSRKSLTG